MLYSDPLVANITNKCRTARVQCNFTDMYFLNYFANFVI